MPCAVRGARALHGGGEGAGSQPPESSPGVGSLRSRMAGQAAAPGGTKGGHGDGPAGAGPGHLPKEAVPVLGLERR